MNVAAAVATNAGAAADSANRVESTWSKLKGSLLDAAKVYSLYKNHQWGPATWWWNEQVDDTVHEKRARFKVDNALTKAIEAKEAQTAYNDATHMAKYAVCLASLGQRKKNSPQYLPKVMVCWVPPNRQTTQNQDVFGENCVHNDTGELALTGKGKIKAWVQPMLAHLTS